MGTLQEAIEKFEQDTEVERYRAELDARLAPAIDAVRARRDDLHREIRGEYLLETFARLTLVLLMLTIAACSQDGVRHLSDADGDTTSGADGGADVQPGIDVQPGLEVGADVQADSGRPLGAACAAASECGSGFCAGSPGARRCCDKPCDGSCLSCGTGYCEAVADNTVCDAGDACVGDGGGPGYFRYAQRSRCQTGACVVTMDDCFAHRACMGSVSCGFACLPAWGLGATCSDRSATGTMPEGCFDGKDCAKTAQMCGSAGVCG